ncbi:ecto-NOX disulfide-thiol exchanger 1 [Trichonephila clavata]|uniref:Ecto-NOX disulfide-thiol exchanger 1 n=1 Tax=Trichonephila clavata TaxID=2740835 RepID=A0A8X6L893_TRICU|nr:ecto-NOX disulfide-thiol exchanger 1 [Trichonephila clavata]
MQVANNSNNNEISLPKESKFSMSPPSPKECAICIPKPLICKTVRITGLPPKITRNIIMEIFRKFGTIIHMRMLRNASCEIQFSNTESVEQALLLSGYRIKIGCNDDADHNGQLFVECAHDCHQQTENVPAYTELEAKRLKKEIYNTQTFRKSLQILISWLKKEECTKMRSAAFYSMLEIVHIFVENSIHKIHVFEGMVKRDGRNLYVLKSKAKKVLHEIKKVFKAIRIRRNWHSLPKTQRRQIKVWKKDVKNLSDIVILVIRIEEMRSGIERK